VAVILQDELAVSGNANILVDVQLPVGTSDWYIIPDGVFVIICQLTNIQGGVARVESTERKDAVADGQNVDDDVIPWTPGDVSVNTAQKAPGISCVRVVSTGTCRFCLTVIPQ
jgi:hypothetical protein